MGQVQEGGQPLMVEVAPEFHVGPAFGPAEDRADGDTQQVRQQVAGISGAGVRQTPKMQQQRVRGRLGVHTQLLVQGSICHGSERAKPNNANTLQQRRAGRKFAGANVRWR